MNTKNLPIIVGIALPILFIIVISLIVFLPVSSIKPAYNFLFTNESQYNYQNEFKNRYEVSNNHIVVKENLPSKDYPYAFKKEFPDIYLYNVADDTTKKIDLDDANKMQLEVGPSSPDGYAVGYHDNNMGIFELFGSGRNESGYYIEKGNAKKRININIDGSRYNYYGNFKLIGWVK